MSELNIGAYEGDDSKGVDSLYDTLVELDTRTSSIDTLAAMQAILAPADGDTVYVKGRTTNSDGFEGVFAFDTSSSATANIGTIFVATDGTTGRWLRQNILAYNVRWFGAVGDGVTNDYYAFNKTVDSLPTEGCTVLFPSGFKFAISGVNTDLAPDYTIFSGYGAELRAAVGGTGQVIWMPRYKTGCKLLGVKINGMWDGGIRAITSITDGTGYTATVTYTDHGLVSGEQITVAGATPAAYNVTDKAVTVLTANTFTYQVASNPGGAASVVGTASWVDSTINPFTIVPTSITSAATDLVTLNLTDHAFSNGERITVAGASPAEYNVTDAVVNYVDANNVTYVPNGNPAGNATTAGTVTLLGDAPGTMSFNGTPGGQKALWIDHATNFTLKDVHVYGSPSDGINGGNNTNITIDNCVVEACGEHGYYFRDSDTITIRNCIGKNINCGWWSEEGKFLKMPNTTKVVVDGFIGLNDLEVSKNGRFIEMQPYRQYYSNVHIQGIKQIAAVLSPDPREGFPITEPTSVTFKNCTFIGKPKDTIAAFDTFSSTWDNDTCVMEDCDLTGFLDITLLPIIKNVTLRGAMHIRMLDTAKYYIDGLHILNTITPALGNELRGIAGSIFKNITIKNSIRTNTCELYAVDSLVENLLIAEDAYLAVDGLFMRPSTTGCVIKNYTCINRRYAISMSQTPTAASTINFINTTVKDCFYMVSKQAVSSTLVTTFENSNVINSNSAFSVITPSDVKHANTTCTDGTILIHSGTTGTVTDLRPQSLSAAVVLPHTSSDFYLVLPVNCLVTRISTIIDGTTVTGDQTIQFKNNAGSNMTNGLLTITHTSNAGAIDSVTPTGNNSFAGGTKLQGTFGGTQSAALNCVITVSFTPNNL